MLGNGWAIVPSPALPASMAASVVAASGAAGIAASPPSLLVAGAATKTP
jgi:hypothetical protein